MKAFSASLSTDENLGIYLELSGEFRVVA